jgi:hypothetical protein
MLELRDDTRYYIAEDTPMVVFHSEGALRLRTDVVHRWPLFARAGRGTVDLSQPGLIAEPFAAKIFSADPAGPVAVGNRDHRLALSTEGPSHIALWTNNRAWAPRGVAPGSYRNLCVERSSAPTDRVSEDRNLRLLGREASLGFEVLYEASR